MKDMPRDLKHLNFLLDKVDFSIAEHEFIYDKEGLPIDYKFIYANEYFCKSLSITQERIVGHTVMELMPDTEQYWVDKYYEVVKTGVPLSMTRYAQELDSHYSVYAYKTGENTFAVCFKDVTEEVIKSEHIKTLKPKDSSFGKVSSIGFFEADRLTFKADVSNSFNEVVGLDRIDEGFFRKTLLELTHNDDYDKISKIIKGVVKGEITEVETSFRMFNKKHQYYHWMSFFVFAIKFDDEGIPFRYTGMVRDIEDEQNKLTEAKEIEDLFAQARRVANLTTFVYDVEKEKFSESIELSDFVGIKDLRSIEQFRSIVHPDDLEIYDEASKHTLSGVKDKVTVYRIIKNGEIVFIQSSVFSKANKEGKVLKVFGILKDVTEIEISRERAERLLESFSVIFNSSPSGIFIMDSDMEISMENKKFREIFNIKPLGMTLKSLLEDNYTQVIENLKKGKEVKHLRLSKFVGNEEKHFVVNINGIGVNLTNDYEGTLVDITQQVIDEERILYLATYDVLTDIYNRNYFEEIVVEKQNEFPLGLVLCDIDGLKLINDAFGHLRGDELLQSLAKTLKELSPSYTVARIGGDEFALLVNNADEEKLESIQSQIKDSIKGLGLYGIAFEVSLGYAILTEEQSNFQKIYNKAENMMYRRKLTDRSSRKSNALTTIMQTLHEKTEETKNHCERVGDYSSMLLYESGFKRNVDLEDIRFLSDVHDIGKIATPEGILSKPSKLTDDEYEQIKYHSEAGYKIIKNIIDNENIAFGILYHHERYDGTGYPHGLVGESIPLYARVLAIADSYDTMIRGRIYQKAISKEEALKDIEKNKGTQFDPTLADTFIRIMSVKK